MQIKKDEIEMAIVKAAEREFLLHGFKGASMRRIGSRAHTSPGNLYTYFPNKIGLFTRVMGDVVEKTDAFIEMHINMTETLDFKFSGSIESILAAYPDLFPFELLLSPAFSILLNPSSCEGTSFLMERERLLSYFNNHLNHHMELESDNPMTPIISNGIVEAILRLNKMQISHEEKVSHLINYIKYQSLGIAKDIVT